ncbi:MAG TPA: hypothetical protein VG797_10730 [Phycisphaerales bacterium]|nr:hypothetical protein [Phycisphaerales bacterium]
MNTPITSPIIIIALLAIVVCGAASCSSNPAPSGGEHETPNTSPAPSPSSADKYRGTLQSGFAAVGGETTGWILARPQSEGGDLEVDVTAVSRQATAFNGKPCVITGRVVDRRYVERGVVKVLRAEQIHPY